MLLRIPTPSRLIRVKVASQKSGGIGLYSCGHDVRSDDAPFLGADSWWAFLARIAEIPEARATCGSHCGLSYAISHQAIGGVQCLVSSVSIISC
jgi:hypothetical protein